MQGLKRELAYDAVLELEPDYGGGELGISLNQARAEWAANYK